MVEDKDLYPFCQNSRRWITTLFVLQLPKTCVAVSDYQSVDCKMEDCAYFAYKPGTQRVRQFQEIGQSLSPGELNSMISSKEEWENMDG